MSGAVKRGGKRSAFFGFVSKALGLIWEHHAVLLGVGGGGIVTGVPCLRRPLRSPPTLRM